MAFTERLALIIDANTSGITRAFRKVDDDTKRLGKSVVGVKRGIGSFAKVAAGGLAVVGIAAVKFGDDFIAAAEESVKVGKQTQAVIKSTGGAAKVTAGQVAKLSEQLSLKAGIDDELIQSGANVLLTFTNIRNEVGKGNDIFNQATTAALDMSVAMGQDLQSSVVQIGKALQDPIKGMSALQRVGVTFTAQQKEQIKTLVESGDVLGAQKVILQELTKEFGGSAEAQATASDKLRVAFGNVAEQIGLVLLPYVEQFATWMTEEGIPLIQNELVPALENFAHWVGDELVPDLRDMAATLNDTVLPTLQRLSEVLVALPTGAQLALAALGVLARFGGFGILAAAATVMSKVIATAFGFVGFAATMAWALISRTVPFAHIAALAFAFRGQLVGVFAAIGRFAAGVFARLRATAAANVAAIAGFFRGLPGRITGAVSSIAGIFGRAMSSAYSRVVSWVGSIVDAIWSIPRRITGVAGAIASKFSGVAGAILDMLPSPGGGVPFIPGIQHGGIVRRPTVALIGEAGPEAVIPLGHRMAAGYMAGGSAGSYVDNRVFNITTGADPHAVVRAIRQAGDLGLPITLRGRRL